MKLKIVDSKTRVPAEPVPGDIVQTHNEKTCMVVSVSLTDLDLKGLQSGNWVAFADLETGHVFCGRAGRTDRPRLQPVGGVLELERV